MNKIMKGVMIFVLLILPLFGYGQMFVSDANFSGVVGSGARAMGNHHIPPSQLPNR